MVNGNSSIEVYCTRPTCNNPQNFISDESLTSSSAREIRCYHCGMPLILGGHFLARKLLVPDEEGGAFGRTFEAEDINFPHKPKRVIKQLHPRIPPGRLQLSPAELRRIEELFKREAIILEQLRHPKIPRALAFFSVEVDEEIGNSQKFFYLVQDYVQGNNLSQELRERGEPFPEDEVINILKEILEILKYVHNYDGHQGAIHRDIKPANIILCSRDRKLYLIDFGAVKQVLDIRFPADESSIVLTRAFAPPEQFRGAPVSPASDLYALATTCLCLLTGDRNPQMLISNSRWRDHVNVSNEHFANILDWMLQYKREDRPQSAQEVLDHLSQRLNLQVNSPQLPNSNVQQNTDSNVQQNTEQPLELQHNFQEITEVEEKNKNTSQKNIFLQKINFLFRRNFRGRGWLSLFFLVLFGVAIALIISQISTSQNRPILTPTLPPPPPTPTPTIPTTPTRSDAKSNANDFSRGENALIGQKPGTSCMEAYELREQGIAAFQIASVSGYRQDFKKAEELFLKASNQFQKAARATASRQNKCEVDPETWIYYYNSKAAQSQSSSTLPTIAVVIPGLERYRDNALEILRGIAQVQKEQAANPLFQILIVKEDSDNKQAVTNVATDISNNNIPGEFNNFKGSNILGVIGHYTSDNTREAGNIYAQNPQKKLVLISPTSTAVRMPGEWSDNVFRTASDDSIAARDLADYLRNRLRKKKVLIIFETKSEYSTSLKGEFAKRLSNTGDIQDCDLSKETEEYCIEKIQKENVQALMLAPSRNKLEEALNIAMKAKQNSPQLSLLGGDVLYGKKTFEILGNTANGMMVAVFSHFTLAKQEFINTANQLWVTGNVSWRTITSYDAAQVFVKALTDLSSNDNLTSQDIYNNLNEPNFSAQSATNVNVEFQTNHGRKPATGVGILVQADTNSPSRDEYRFIYLEIPER
ncbi:MAG: protein kinase domain-containing protein [Nostoc sp. EkiNYC01]|nr:bifunctional serine/threonine-protein kinase/ABC transporter substrate-binding protein [Nostoc sp. EkiNYC01]